MFTGLITDVGRIVTVETREKLKHIRFDCSYATESLVIGASIACGGPCLTVTGFGERNTGSWFEVDAAWETLQRTTVADWREGDRVNLERSLKIGDELGGHLVTGHVDGVATLLRREEITAAEAAWGESARFTIKAPKQFARFIAPKGSVTLDGTSLTVNTVEDDVFTVLLIPHTLSVTTWGKRKEGDRINLEVDLMARYAARLAGFDASE